MIRQQRSSRFGSDLVLLGVAVTVLTTQAAGADVATTLRALRPEVLADGESLRSMLRDDAASRLRTAERRESEAWRAVRMRHDWERLRNERIERLKVSLGEFPSFPPGAAGKLHVDMTGSIEGDRCRIEKLVYESRSGLLVTANLYVPLHPPASMPGIIICHSHHAPKTQGELQDMGTLWARQGCLVLVPDQLGHGERRQHPFRTSDDYPAEFRAGRQDYYFRYNVAQQLHLVGESLIGWMAWDLLRGVDLLLQRPGIDPARIILLGAVAGGGDPAAVTAAIDPRIAAAVPFNFGGPQPETQYPLPDDAEHSFRYAGGGSWESTRNLRLSARDGFPPWVIVGSLAPRRLIYAHEFVWDRDRDPVWKRLETIHAWYDASDSLAFAHGFGRLQGNPPDASHCTNIGPPHREMMTPSLQRWFGIQATEQARINPRPADQLLCLSGKATDGLTLTPVHRLADRLAGESLRRARNDAAGTTPTPIRPETLRTRWRTLLGDVDPYPVAAESRGTEPVESIQVERLLLTGERNVRLPVLLLTPARPRQSGQRPPLVVGLSQHGKSGFLEHRSDLLAQLLDAGIAVCLPDLRGCGESRPGDGRGRQSEATSVSSSELMLGQTLLGSRLKDLRSLLNYLRARPDVDPRRIALCGESFAPVNPPDANLERPLDVDQPALAEPLGPTLALLGALFEDDVAAVSAQGGLVSFRSVLQNPFLHLPHDAIVPGALTIGDLPDLVAALSPRPVLVAGLVDGLNRRVAAEAVTDEYGAATQDAVSLSGRVRGEPVSERELVGWLRGQLSR